MTQSTYLNGAELVGVTGTYYDDKSDPRFAIALETAERYQDAGLPLIAVDNSPGRSTNENWVQDELKIRDVLVLPATIGGIATQRQQGVGYAVQMGAERIVSHEPEKTLTVEFADQIVEGLKHSDLLVIGRSAEAEDSLPPVQQRIERLGGWILENTHGLPADTMSGGRGFTVKGAEYMISYPANDPGMNNWIYLYSTLIDAKKQDTPVGGIKIDLVHPSAMVAEETGNHTFDRKRYDQFVLQLSYILNSRRVDNRAAQIADATLEAIDNYSNDTSDDEFVTRLANLESEFTDLGYTPPARLQARQ